MNELINLYENFHFIRPWWLISILPALLVLIFLWKSKNQNSNWSGIISNDLMPFLLVQQQVRTTRAPFFLLGLVWILASIAMAGPAWNEIPQPVEKKIQARVIILDLSTSMKSKDIAPSRYARAKHKLSDLLKTYKEGETGLIAYAGDAHVITPLTDDTKTISNLIPSLRPEIMPIKGSNAFAAIESAVTLLQNTGHTSGHIILITDGVEGKQVDPIQNIDKLDLYNLSILGVGTKTGQPILMEDGSFLKDRNKAIVIPKLEASTLNSLAHQLGGRYVEISTDDTDIDTLNKTVLGSKLGTKTKKTSQQFDTWQDMGPWIVLFCLPIASIAFRKGWLGVMVLGVFLYGSTKPEPSQASAWDDLWTRRDQQGQQAFDKKEFEKAATLFKNKDWKASSLYRQGDFEAAAEAYSSAEQSNSLNENALYNQANALAKANQLKEAVDLYEQILSTNPNHKDAQHNSKLVSDVLKKQQSSQNKGDQSANEKNKQKDQKKDQQQNSSDSEDQNKQNQSDSEQQDQQDQEKQQADQNKPSENEDDKNSKDPQKQQAQQQEKENKDDSSSDKTKWQNENTDDEHREQQQALEQWLKRIPDDPGDLLKRKFYLQSLQNEQQDSRTPW